MNFLNKNILICCHDAGSANLIYFWKKKHKKNNFFFYNKGPALKIFKKKNINLNQLIKLKLDIIITGTSQFSDLENKIRFIARRKKIFSVTFLDHYVNYKKRFIFKGKLELPDELWSFDIYSFKIAKKTFKNVTIKRKLNYFVSYLKKKVIIKKKFNNNYLYFTEPFFFKNRGNEFIYLRKFLNYFKNKKKLNIKIKLHPSEKLNKYDKIIKDYKNLNIKVIKNSKLENLINWCDKVYGCETYAMIIAKKCNRKVYTLMSSKKFRLPKKLIKSF